MYSEGTFFLFLRRIFDDLKQKNHKQKKIFVQYKDLVF